MSFCPNCGSQLGENAKFCANCGAPTAGENPAPAPEMNRSYTYRQPAYGQENNNGYGNAYNNGNGYNNGYNAYNNGYNGSYNNGYGAKPVDNGAATVIKIFMVLGCVAFGWLLIPLAWCIPMTVSVFKSLNNGTPISTGMKVCTLLFVSMIAGIVMLATDC